MPTGCSRSTAAPIRGRDFAKVRLASGLSIAHTLGTSSRRYTFQQPPKLIDLGLRLADVQSLGLEDLAEEVEYDSKKSPRENLAESGATETEQRFLAAGARRGTTHHTASRSQSAPTEVA